MEKRTMVLAGAGLVVAAGLGGLAIGAALDDGDEPVAAIDVAGSPTQDGEGSGGTVRVPALEQLRGTVSRDGDDVDDLVVQGVELDFGPDSWIRSAGPVADLDGDGTEEDLANELDGLVGKDVTLDVRFDDDGDEADVYRVDGVTFREVGGPAPWQPEGTVDEAAARAAALAAVGEGAELLDLDPNDDGGAVAWEAEVRDAQGREHDVDLDAAGNVLSVRPD